MGLSTHPTSFLLVLATVAQASAPLTVEKHAYRPYPPVEVTSYVIETPRPVRAWAAKVDLTSDDIEFVVTPRGTVEDEFETACATTLAFARSNGLQLAINATPFRPYRQKAGDGMEVVGLAASDGDVYSQPHPTFGALVLSKSGEANIVRPPFDRLAWRDVDEAVGGFRVLVEDGLSRLPRIINEIPPDFAAPNPRSAVGLSADRKTMWLIVVDGRIPGRSEGMSLEELADFAIGLGCGPAAEPGWRRFGDAGGAGFGQQGVAGGEPAGRAGAAGHAQAGREQSGYSYPFGGNASVEYPSISRKFFHINMLAPVYACVISRRKIAGPADKRLVMAVAGGGRRDAPRT